MKQLIDLEPRADDAKNKSMGRKLIYFRVPDLHVEACLKEI